MNLVWQHAPYEGNTLLTLLAFADWADDEGVCWPKMATAAKKTRQSERNVKNCVKRLIDDGVLVVLEESKGPGVSNKYQIREEIISPLLEARGENSDTKGVKFATGRGEICDIAIRKNHQEPSGEPDMSDGASDPSPQLSLVSDSPNEKEPPKAPPVKRGPETRIRSFADELKRHTKDPWELEKLPKIWAYYCERTDRGSMYLPTERRVRAGLGRLRDLMSANQQDEKKARVLFAMAIDNLANDKFLSGENDRNTEYRDWLDHLCKNWETFEKRLRAN